MEPSKIVIMGAGGMGALFGMILQEGGLSVTLVDSNAAHVEAVKRDGLLVEGFGGKRRLTIPMTQDASELSQADLVLFQCKAQGTRDAAKAVRHLVEGGAVCVSFQNGLGNEEVMAEELGSASVLGGLTAMAGELLGPGRIRDFSRVPSTLGEMEGGISERAAGIARSLTAAGLETEVSDNIRRDIWKKLLGNIAMSAVSGITDMTSARCLAVPALRDLSLRAMDEALAVAKALRIDLDRDKALAGLAMISKPGGTGDSKSSLCVDLLNKRRSEVDTIYGSVIAKGRELGVATPTLETLAALVKGLESKFSEG